MDYKKLADELHGCSVGTVARALTGAHADGAKEAEARLKDIGKMLMGQVPQEAYDAVWKAKGEAEAKLAQAEAANSKLIEALNGSEHMLQGKEAELLDLQTKYEALVPDRDQAEALAFCVEKKCGELRAQNAALISELFELRRRA